MARKPLSAPRVDSPLSLRVAPNGPDAVNLVLIRPAHGDIRVANDCYYMLKDFPPVRGLFGSLPGAQYGYHGETVLITIPVIEN